MISEAVQKELDRTRKFGDQMAQIVCGKTYSTDERDLLLLAYWDIVSDLHRGIHALIKLEFFSSAFALVRPVVETLVRAHVAIKGSPTDLRAIQADEYRVKLKEIGPWIDTEFGLGNLMENFLNQRTRDALHSYTHAGLLQLGRRFSEGYIKPQFKDGEIIEVLRVVTSAVFMLTNLVIKYFGFVEDSKAVDAIYNEWSNPS